jgi:hypothetical protein
MPVTMRKRRFGVRCMRTVQRQSAIAVFSVCRRRGGNRHAAVNPPAINNAISPNLNNETNRKHQQKQ